MRFGTVDTFISLTPDELRIGKNVANHGFFLSLLKHGSWDEYHVFLPDLEHVEMFRRCVWPQLPHGHLRRRVKLSVHAGLREAIATDEFSVFHQGDFTRYFPYLAPLRDRYSAKPFPITGLTHSLNAYFLPQRYLQLAVARLASYDAIVCTSRAGEEVVRRSFAQLQRRISEQLEVTLELNAQLAHIPLGLEDACFTLPERAAARQQLGLPEDSVILLVLARVAARSKMDLFPLIHGLAERWRAGQLPRLHLLIAGGAERGELDHLRRLLQELEIDTRVSFHLDFPAEDKGALYGAADLFASLSDNFQETFGLTVIEAMAAGIPPIVSDFNGYRELVNHGLTGLRIPTLWREDALDGLDGLGGIMGGNMAFFQAQSFVVDLDAALNSITLLAEDEGLRRQLGEHARAESRQYLWPNIIGRYERLWARLADEAGKTKRRERRGADPLEFSLAEAFGHYPTATLGDDLELALTARGEAAAAGGGLPTGHKDAEIQLFNPLVAALLQILAEGPAPMDQLMEVGNRLSVPAGPTSFHLLWLMKYGLIRTVRALVPRDGVEG